MTYNPRTYWEERPLREGARYVGHHKATLSDDQAQERVFSEALATAFIARTLAETLLDFGCGSGRFTALMAGMAKKYEGVDISMAGINLAPASLPSNARLQWLVEDRLPFADGAFDAAVAVTVIQHIPDWDWLNVWAPELARVLAPGARIAIIDDRNGTAEHMFPRGAFDIAEQIGCRVCCGGMTILPSGHWTAVMIKREDV